MSVHTLHPAPSSAAGDGKTSIGQGTGEGHAIGTSSGVDASAGGNGEACHTGMARRAGRLGWNRVGRNSEGFRRSRTMGPPQSRSDMGAQRSAAVDDPPAQTSAIKKIRKTRADPTQIGRMGSEPPQPNSRRGRACGPPPAFLQRPRPSNKRRRLIVTWALEARLRAMFRFSGCDFGRDTDSRRSRPGLPDRLC